jgi:hypothetical protein
MLGNDFENEKINNASTHIQISDTFSIRNLKEKLIKYKFHFIENFNFSN